MTAPPSGPLPRLLRVLIVDGNAESRQRLAVVLRRRGYEVVEAASHGAGLGVLRAGGAIDLIVLEVDPAQGGNWIVDEQRRNLIVESIPVLAFAVRGEDVESDGLFDHRVLARADLIDELLSADHAPTPGASSRICH